MRADPCLLNSRTIGSGRIQEFQCPPFGSAWHISGNSTPYPSKQLIQPQPSPTGKQPERDIRGNGAEIAAPDRLTRALGSPRLPGSGVCAGGGMADKTTRNACTMTYKWRWAESTANPSLPNSLFNRENTGNFYVFEG